MAGVMVLTKKERICRALSRSGWSSREIALVRKMAAAGFSASATAEALGTGMLKETVRQRAKRLGIIFHSHRRAHYGAKVSLPNERTHNA